MSVRLEAAPLPREPSPIIAHLRAQLGLREATTLLKYMHAIIDRFTVVHGGRGVTRKFRTRVKPHTYTVEFGPVRSGFSGLRRTGSDVHVMHIQ